MPRRSAISLLPAEVGRELDRRLAAGGFGGHADLADWLAGQGYAISRSSVQRHSAGLARRIEQIKVATEQAEALRAASPDEGAMAEGTLRLVQQRMFDLMLAAEEDDPRALASAARAVAEVSRAGVQLRRERREVLEEAVEAAEAKGRAEGVTDETFAVMRRLLLGERYAEQAG